MRIWFGSAAILLGAAVGATAPAAVRTHKVTRDYSFTYSYPDQAARIPALRAWIEQDKARLKTGTASDAADDRRERRRFDFPFIPYESERTWKVVADTPRFLSLSGYSYIFTGGAHGLPSSMGLIWDKTAHRRLAPLALFASPAAVDAATSAAFCIRLKAEVAKRNNEPMEGRNPPYQCPTLKDLTLLLGSSNGQRIDRIGLIADPYVAGSYAEGSYEVTLPVTRALLDSVEPEYRAAFALGK
jgi:hypothetical protein